MVCEMTQKSQSHLSFISAGFSHRDLILVVALIMIASVSILSAVSWMARKSLAPFLLLEPGQSVEEILKIVGEPEHRTKSLSLIRDHSELDSFACQRLGSSLPGFLKPMFSATSTNYGPYGEVPLPEVTGEVLVFFPFLYEVLLYVDGNQKLEMVLYCCT